MPQIFSLAQAHTALLYIAPVVQDIVEKSIVLEQLTAEKEPVDKNAHEQQMRKIFKELEYNWNELKLTGAQLKDARLGLVDFPSTYLGRPIVLCWMLGESDIHFWHELDQGFTARKKIDEKFAMAVG